MKTEEVLINASAKIIEGTGDSTAEAIQAAICWLGLTESASDAKASGALKSDPRMKPTVRFPVRKESNHADRNHGKADKPISKIGGENEPYVQLPSGSPTSQTCLID